MDLQQTLLTALRRRRRSGETFDSIAEGAGVPQPVVTRFVAGSRQTIKLDTAAKLAKYLRLELREKPPRKSAKARS